MGYSDTRVILQLGTYAFTLLNYSLDNQTQNGAEMRTVGGVAAIQTLILLVIYFFSFVGLFISPWLSSLRIAYKTCVSLLDEDVDMSTDLGTLGHSEKS